MEEKIMFGKLKAGINQRTTDAIEYLGYPPFVVVDIVDPSDHTYRVFIPSNPSATCWVDWRGFSKITDKNEVAYMLHEYRKGQVENGFTPKA